MSRSCGYLLWVSAAGVLAAGVCISCRKTDAVESCTAVGRAARISPDYTDTVIPPNVAPMNFRVLEAGEKFFVKIHAPHGQTITVSSRNANIKIPLKPWKTLLSENRGERICFDVFVYESRNGWRRYETLSNTVADEEIDSYLVFRFIRPIYTGWNSIGIYQRNIENYKTSLVLHGHSFRGACINCHSFCSNSPEKMSIATRSEKFGNASLMVCGDRVNKVDAAWGYTAWHPSGELAVYSTNKVRQFFHTTELENRDVIDLDSAILYYVLKGQQTKTIPALSQRDDLETYPAWSPDGKYLYYCSAPILWEDRDEVVPKDYSQVKYNLMRISYDVQSDQWGQPEVMISAKETNLSIGLPRVSPDGKFVIFTMCDYSCFPIYRPSSDLYMMDIATREYKKLDVINSPYSESWHSFSSNGRWLAFSSKKCGGLFTRTYFTYIDENGLVHKPFILPQKNPTYYDSLLQTYSVPELITQPIQVSPRILTRAARSDVKIPVRMPISGATPTTQSSEPYQQGGK